MSCGMLWLNWKIQYKNQNEYIAIRYHEYSPKTRTDERSERRFWKTRPNTGRILERTSCECDHWWRKVSACFVGFIHYCRVESVVSTIVIGLATSSFTFSFALVLGSFFTPTGWIVTYLYYMLCEWKFGSTPGKMVFGRVVIDKNGVKPDLQTLAARTLIRFIPFEAFSCLSDRGWHDKWSETFVVHKDEAKILLQELQKANQKAEEFSAQQTQS